MTAHPWAILVAPHQCPFCLLVAAGDPQASCIVRTRGTDFSLVCFWCERWLA